MKFDGWPHIVESQQFSREWLEQAFFPLAKTMEDVVAQRGNNDLSSARMISFFYQSSTRTRASFEIAMDYLGGRVVFSTENAREFSSAKKGETIRDTIRVLNRYRPDVIVLRYDEEGGAKIAAEVSTAAIINAGDASGQHPTQALLDIYTIQKKLDRIDNISIAMVGDLGRGRTVRSLSYLLAKFADIKVYFVSPEESMMREDIKDYLRKHNVWFTETDDLKATIPLVDVVYQTRVQDEYEGGTIDISDFTIDEEIADSMKKDAIIMHPLPRREEITLGVDDNPRAVYIDEQVDSGLFARMALLKMLLS